MNRRRRRMRKREQEKVTKLQNEAKQEDPKGVRSALVVGVRNDGTPFVDVVGTMNLFEMDGALTFASHWLEDIWIEKIDVIKKKLDQERNEELQVQAEQQAETDDAEKEQDVAEEDEVEE